MSGEHKPKRKELKCTRCPKEYQSQSELIRHLRKIHGLNESEAENKIPQQVRDVSKSKFLFFCMGCHGVFEPKRGAYGLPYNGIQHIVCENCQEYLKK